MHVHRLADFFYSRKGLGVFSTDFLRRAYNYTRTDIIIHNVIIGFPFLTLVASICSGWWDLVEVVADLCKIVAWVSSGYKKFLRLIVNTSVLVPICCKISDRLSTNTIGITRCDYFFMCMFSVLVVFCIASLPFLTNILQQQRIGVSLSCLFVCAFLPFAITLILVV